MIHGARTWKNLFLGFLAHRNSLGATHDYCCSVMPLQFGVTSMQQKTKGNALCLSQCWTPAFSQGVKEQKHCLPEPDSWLLMISSCPSEKVAKAVIYIKMSDTQFR